MADSTMTCVMIAHRLSTIRGADRIAVVGHGKVREIGTHDELMAREDGLYRKMQSLQNLEVGGVTEKPTQHTKDSKGDEEDTKRSSSSVTATTDEMEVDIDKEQESGNAKRARQLAMASIQYFLLGGVGARESCFVVVLLLKLRISFSTVMGGSIFVSWGFVFAYMIEVLYRPVLFCDDSDPINECPLQWDEEAENMYELSLKIFYGLLGIISMALIGFTLVRTPFCT